MPIFIPVVLGALAVSAMGWGTKKGYDGVSDVKEAKRIAESAQWRHDSNARVLEEARQRVNAAANDFGIFKLEVARDTIGSMVRLLEELQRRGKLTSFESLDGVEFEPDSFVAELRAIAGTATKVLAGAVVGVVKGSLTGAAVYGLAGTIGVASTGAAITGLSGAALESATLAWIGGGALSAGGFGMAGGMVVLGGIVAAPIFLITGYSLASAGAKAMVNAQKFVGDVDVAIAGMDLMNAALAQIRARMDELRSVICAVQERATDKLSELRGIVDGYDENDRAHSGVLVTAMNTCKALTDLIKAPVIVGESGGLNPELQGLIARYKEFNP